MTWHEQAYELRPYYTVCQQTQLGRICWQVPLWQLLLFGRSSGRIAPMRAGLLPVFDDRIDWSEDIVTLELLQNVAQGIAGSGLQDIWREFSARAYDYLRENAPEGVQVEQKPLDK